MGLFRNILRGEGQKSPPLERAEANSGAERRLPARSQMVFEMDMLMCELATVAEDIHAIAGRARHQRFTDEKPAHLHYRCITQIRFYETVNWADDVAFYLECPDSLVLIPIVRAMRDRRCNGFSVVWVFGLGDDPFVLPDETTMYVSDEPDVAGLTLDQVRSRYDTQQRD